MLYIANKWNISIQYRRPSAVVYKTDLCPHTKTPYVYHHIVDYFCGWNFYEKVCLFVVLNFMAPPLTIHAQLGFLKQNSIGMIGHFSSMRGYHVYKYILETSIEDYK